jgi:opacity protein-like surface antigen
MIPLEFLELLLSVFGAVWRNCDSISGRLLYFTDTRSRAAAPETEYPLQSIRGLSMMKILLGTTMLAGVLIAGAAQAADMPLKAPRAAPIYSDWTGFYLGIHGGYGWGEMNPDDLDFGGPFHNPKPKGGVFGGQAGYNWQYGRAVVGLELDYSGASLKEDQEVNFNFCNQPVLTSIRAQIIRECGTVGFAVRSKIDALASARARAGFLLTDNLLAFGTAGLGWGHSAETIALTFNGNDVLAFKAKTDHFGWVAGGGLEYKFAQNWLIRGEYLHYDFGSVGYAFQPFLTINTKTTADVARGALSYKF